MGIKNIETGEHLDLREEMKGGGDGNKRSYLQVLEKYTVSRPIDLSEERLVNYFTHQFEQIDFTLIVGLVVQETEELVLPILVIRSCHLQVP